MKTQNYLFFLSLIRIFASEMKRFLIYIKESVQYVLIILLSLLSALWLTITGKRRH